MRTAKLPEKPNRKKNSPFFSVPAYKGLKSLKKPSVPPSPFCKHKGTAPRRPRCPKFQQKEREKVIYWAALQ